MFWTVTPREMRLITDGAAMQHRRAQGLVYSLAQLVRIAVNSPKNFPTFEKAFPEGKAKPKPAQTPQQMMAVLRALTVQRGGAAPDISQERG